MAKDKSKKEKKPLTEHVAYLEQEIRELNGNRALFQYAIDNELSEGEIHLPNGQSANAAEYALLVFAKACQIGSPPALHPNVSEKWVDAAANYLHVAILVALEALQASAWNYGIQLLNKLHQAGITITTSERNAFLAQSGRPEQMRELYEGNALAVSIYCARQIIQHNTLTGLGNGLCEPETDQVTDMRHVISMTGKTDFETLEILTRKYVTVRLGNEKKVDSFLRMLAQRTDFYTAPASARHNLARPGGLAEHTVNVITRLAENLLPATPAQIGELVLASLCMGLCKLNYFLPYQKTYRQYRENGSRKDSHGTYEEVTFTAYREKSELSLGEGAESALLAQQCFGTLLPESVMSAVDAHKFDQKRNAYVGYQVMEHPLGLWLHIADICATYLDEAHTGPGVKPVDVQPDKEQAASLSDKDVPAEKPDNTPPADRASAGRVHQGGTRT